MKVQISEETREAVAKDDIPLGIQAQVLRKRMADMDEDDAGYLKAAVRLQKVEKAIERKRLQRRMRDLDDDDECGVMGW